MQNPIFIQIKKELPKTNYFVYKKDQYPFNFDLFKYSSNFFVKNQKLIEESQIIQLVDKDSEDSLNFSSDTIQNFINYVQREPIPLSKENVVALNYLASRYEVDSLIKDTEEYISEHHDEIALQILLIHQNDSKFQTKTYENVISEHFPDYINNDQLLSINISILYRIFTKYQTKNQTNENEILDFLFKCLDKYGKEASVLFTNINFDNIYSDHLNRLLTDYSNIFDFHYINSAFLKTIYDKQSEIIRNQIQQEKFFFDIKKEFEKMKSDFANQLDSQKKKYENEISQLRSEMNTMSEMHRQKEDSFEKSQIEYNSKIKELEKRNEELSKEQLNSKSAIENLQKLSEIQMNRIDCQHGIFHYFFETYNENPVKQGLISIEGNSDNPGYETVLPEIINSKWEGTHWCSKMAENSYIKIDFKEFLVKIDKYHLKVGNSFGSYRFNSWTLMGITKDNKEIILHEVNNSSEITKSHPETTVSIHNDSFVNSIRLIMRGKNSENCFYMCMFNIELYGSILELK
ncbi:hypothetical protein M9Y10_037932 [Tritrichomonas musculus]|uniref:SUN domain-containing protein n=1 Tax=Tritrichomonas musculus TaxID=1915356 RepID=A0ABR2K771_9EUKA